MVLNLIPRYWFIEKNHNDFIARCKCGYKYNCTEVIYVAETNYLNTSIRKLYRYCPECGRKYRITAYKAMEDYFK